MTKNLIGSIFFLLFSLFYFFNVFSIKRLPGEQFEIMTPSTFPYYIGLLGIFVSLVLLILSLKDKNSVKISLDYLNKLDLKSVFLFMLIMIFYGFTIQLLGFIVSTSLFLIAGFLILKEKNFKKIILISLGISVGFYLILSKLLGIYISSGEIFDYFIKE